jgi:hypothetical protein
VDKQLKYTLEHVVDNQRAQQVAGRDTVLYGHQLGTHVQTVVVVITDKSIMSSVAAKSECGLTKGDRNASDTHFMGCCILVASCRLTSMIAPLPAL